jgi:alpha-galactosidase
VNRLVRAMVSWAAGRRRLGIVVSGLAAVAGALAIPVSSADATMATDPVPYMGWSTYYGLGENFNEATIKSVASSLISSGLAQAGYKIVWLELGWASGARGSSGNLILDSTQWPDGMSGLTSWLHARGLYAGIYTDAGTSGCNGQGVGSYGHYKQDVDQFAAWGFDAIKLDFCGLGQEWLDQPPNDPRTLYGQFSHAVAAAPRPMILNVCNFWTPGKINGSAPSYEDSSWDTFSWAPAVAQSWRTDTDIGFIGNIQFQWVLRNLDQDSTPYPNAQDAAGPPGSSGSAWGHWNDPDYLGPGLGMTSTQAQSQFSMWAMVAAPLILGSDPRSLSSTAINMLKNSRVIAIDQDSLGVQGWLVSQTGTGQQVWVKPLAGGARAVALFNRGSSAQRIRISATASGLPGTGHYRLLNVWTNQTSQSRGTISAFVRPDAVVLYRVTTGHARFRARILGGRPDERLERQLAQPRTRLSTRRCLPICRWRVNPWRSNIATAPLWRNDPDTVRPVASSG